MDSHIRARTVTLFTALLTWLTVYYFCFENDWTSPYIPPIKNVGKHQSRVDSMPSQQETLVTTDDSPVNATGGGRMDHTPTRAMVNTQGTVPRQHRYTSNLYQITETPSGIILRQEHIVGATRNASTSSSASGAGLHRGHVGRPSSFIVKIVRPTSSLYGRYIYLSVLLVGKDHLQPVEATKEEHQNGAVLVHYSFVPTMPGKYRLFVEEMSKSYQRQIPGSPFALNVTGDKIDMAERRTQIDKLPSCQLVSQKNPTWIQGSWITRVLAGTRRGTLRSGWVYQPYRCSFDIFSREELSVAVESSKPNKIAILATSTERGIFLTMIDLLLNAREKDRLQASNLGRCWGFAQFKMANLTLIYQDFRIYRYVDSISTYRQLNGSREITCHNEKLADERVQLVDDALGFLRETLFIETAQPWPDVVFMVVSEATQLELLLKAIPPEWNGTLYPVTNFRSQFGEFYTVRQKNMAELRRFPTLDPRVRSFDAFALGAGMRHATESSPLIMGANHFHRWCDELDGEMRVCGNPTEMAAQMLLGRVLAPAGKDKWAGSVKLREQKVDVNTAREMEICHDCPRTLLPFHIKRNPNQSCYKSGRIEPAHAREFVVWDGTLCPEECRKNDPVGEAYTQSGTVDVRICTVPKL